MFVGIFYCSLGNNVQLKALDLRSALYEMSKTDPAILAKQKELEAARHELDLAKSGYYPKLDIQGSIGNERAKSQLTQYQDRSWTSNNAGVTLTQNLFAGFATKNDVATKEYKIKARKYALIEQANDSALRLSKSYMDLLRAYELLLIEVDNVKTHEKIFKDLKIRTEGGSGRISDYMEVSAKLSLAYSNLLSEDNNYNDAVANFHKAIGRYEDGKNLVQPDDIKGLPIKLEEALAQALASNPSLLVSRYEIEAAKTAMRLERQGYLPKIDATLNAKTSENASGLGGKNDSSSALITLSWNLYNGGSDYARVERAVSGIENSIEKLHTLQREVMEGMGLSFNAYSALDRQKEFLAIYEESNSHKKEYYQEEFDLGRRSLIDLLNAEDEYNVARRKLVQNRYDRLNAQFRILDAKGELLSYFGINVDENHNQKYSYDSDNVEKEHPKVICQNTSDITFGIGGCQIIPQPKIYDFIDTKAKVVMSENTLAVLDTNDTNQLQSVKLSASMEKDQSKCSEIPQYIEALKYLDQNNSQENKLKAFHLLVDLARNNEPKSQFMLARMYNQGIGIAADKNKAGYWYREAARNGYSPAYLIVWSYYRDGTGGIGKDQKKAEFWRIKALETRKGDSSNSVDECINNQNKTIEPLHIQKTSVVSKVKNNEKIKSLEERLRDLGISLNNEHSILGEARILKAPPPLQTIQSLESPRK